jgi:glycosyltransferase involved in cell wall biosynthesis
VSGGAPDTTPGTTEQGRRSLAVTIVAANSFEFDSRFLHTAITLAADGHRLRVLGWSAPGLPEQQDLAPGVPLTRLEIDRRISLALRPLPAAVRSLICHGIGLDPGATVLPPEAPHGADRLRHPIRRVLELVANVRRAGPWTDAVLAAAPGTDVFHAQSLIALPVVRQAARHTHARFVYDVADYHTEAARLARMPGPIRSLFRWQERRWVQDAAGFLAVSEPAAELVAERWGVRKPRVLLNCPPAWRPDEPGPVASGRLRGALVLPESRPIVLYQGGFSVDRGIEELVAAANEAALRTLDAAVVFMGYGRLEGWLRQQAVASPGRVYLLPAVPPDELLEWTASADVSFVGQPPRTLNQKMNLPNKLFESLMAGTPVVVSKGNEQCRLVSEEEVGVCCNVDAPAEVAAAIAGLLGAPADERQRLRAHCRDVALRKYTWDANAGGLVELYRELAGPVGRATSVALIINNPFTGDSRAWKMATTLSAAGYRVTIVARATDDLPPRAEEDGFSVVRVPQPDPFRWLPHPRLPTAEGGAEPGGVAATLSATLGRTSQAARYLRLTKLWARDIAEAVGPMDVWQAEGLVALPVAVELRRTHGGLAIYDSRDLDVQSARFARLPGPWRRLLERRERGWARSVDGLISVSRPYAKVLQASFDREPTIVMNGPPDFEPPDPPERLWHERLGLEPRTRVVLYLGLFIEGRGLTQLMEAIGRVDGAVLVMAGYGVEEARYREFAAGLPHAERIRFVGGVAPQEILPLTAAADVSAMPVQGDTLNHRLNTPTKLFDAMGAGVPVVASDLPGMAPIVRDTGCGELCNPDDPADIVRAISLILDASPERRAEYRDACLAAARGEYSWERQAERLLGLYGSLVPARATLPPRAI